MEVGWLGRGRIYLCLIAYFILSDVNTLINIVHAGFMQTNLIENTSIKHLSRISRMELACRQPKSRSERRKAVSVNNDDCHTAPRRQSNMAFSPEPSVTDIPVFDIRETVNHSRDHLSQSCCYLGRVWTVTKTEEMSHEFEQASN